VTGSRREAKVSGRRVARASCDFASTARAAHPKIKAWPPRLWIGHEADTFILEVPRSPVKGSQVWQ